MIAFPPPTPLRSTFAVAQVPGIAVSHNTWKLQVAETRYAAKTYS